MADQDKIPVEIDISSTYNPKGVNDAAAGMAGLEKSINGAAAKAKLLGKLMRGLGWIAIIQQAVNLYQNLRDKIIAAKEAAEKLAEDRRQAAADAAVKNQIGQYDQLKASIAAVNAELARKAELEAIAKGGKRGVEDAKSLVAEQSELSAIAFDDPERREKEDAVRSKYARQRAITAASREKEDIALQRQNLTASGQSKSREADRLDASADAIARDLRDERSIQEMWMSASKGAMGKDWLTGAPKETPASKSLAAAGESAKKRADELEKKLDAAEKEIAELRTAAAFDTSKAAALFPAYEAADARIRAADMEGGRNTRSAADAVGAARKEREDKARAQAEAVASREREAAQKRLAARGAQRQLSDLESAELKERVEYDRAKYAFDKLPKSKRSGAEESLRREEQEAREAARALGAARPELIEFISKLLADAKRLEAEVKQLSKRQNNARVDAGNID